MRDLSLIIAGAALGIGCLAATLGIGALVYQARLRRLQRAGRGMQSKRLSYATNVWPDDPLMRAENGGRGMCRQANVPGHCTMGCIGCDTDHVRIALSNGVDPCSMPYVQC